MKNATLFLFLALSGASMPALADHHAQDGGHAGHSGHSGHTVPAAAKPAVSPAFASLDKNKDGALSKAEMAGHPMAAHFGMMDANRDGKLSPKEFGSM